MSGRRLAPGDAVVWVNGLSWIVREGTDDFLGPEHEPVSGAAIRVRKGDVAIDVGAHVGHFAIRWAAKGAEVMAIEPGRSQGGVLVENMRLNAHLIRNRITFRAVAAWDCHARLNLVEGVGNAQAAVAPVRVEEPGGMVYGVPLQSLVWSQGYQHVDVIKIDAQGAEGRVLRGAVLVLARFRPRVFIELHDRELKDPSIRLGVEEALTEAGYRWRIYHSNATNDYLVAWHPKDGRPFPGSAVVWRVRVVRAWQSIRVWALRRVWALGRELRSKL